MDLRDFVTWCTSFFSSICLTTPKCLDKFHMYLRNNQILESPGTYILMSYYMSLGEQSLKTNLVVFGEDLGFSIEVGPSDVKTPTMNMWQI